MPATRPTTRPERDVRSPTSTEPVAATASAKAERFLATIAEDIVGEKSKPPSPTSWQHMMRVPSVAKALKEYEAAQVAIASTNRKPQPIESTPRKIGLLQHSSEPKRPTRMTTKEHNTTGSHGKHASSSEDGFHKKQQVPSSPSVEDASDSGEEVQTLTRTDTGLSTPGYFDNFDDYGMMTIRSMRP